MIKGLTILELVVVGLITSLVISLGYNAVMIIQQVNSRKKELHEASAAVEKLNQLVKFTMQEADTVFWSSEDELLDFGKNQLLLEPEVVYIQNGLSDSLHIRLLEKKILEIQLSEGLKVVQSISLTIELDSMELIIQGDKNYSNYFKEGLGL